MLLIWLANLIICSLSLSLSLFAYCNTTGDESGMLEDMCVAVSELGTVSFQVCSSHCCFLARKNWVYMRRKNRVRCESKWVGEKLKKKKKHKRKDGNKKKKKKIVFPPGIEPGTLRV